MCAVVISARERRAGEQPADPSQPAKSPSPACVFHRVMQKVGAHWDPAGLVSIVEAWIVQVSTLMLSAALSGLLYQALGGAAMLAISPGAPLLRTFVLPYIFLVLASVAVDHGIYVAVMVLVYPIAELEGYMPRCFELGW